MDHDLEIKSKRNIFNVEKIKFATFDHLIDIFGIAKLHHAPAGQAGLHLVQVLIVRVRGRNDVDVVGALRPGPDKAHIAA